MYWALKKWLAVDAASFGIRATFVDATNLDAIRAAIVPGETRLIWIETPANPMWGVTDIARRGDRWRIRPAQLSASMPPLRRQS